MWSATLRRVARTGRRAAGRRRRRSPPHRASTGTRTARTLPWTGAGCRSTAAPCCARPRVGRTRPRRIGHGRRAPNDSADGPKNNAKSTPEPPGPPGLRKIEPIRSPGGTRRDAHHGQLDRRPLGLVVIERDSGRRTLVRRATQLGAQRLVTRRPGQPRPRRSDHGQLAPAQRRPAQQPPGPRPPTTERHDRRSSPTPPVKPPSPTPRQNVTLVPGAHLVKTRCGIGPTTGAAGSDDTKCGVEPGAPVTNQAMSRRRDRSGPTRRSTTTR